MHLCAISEVNRRLREDAAGFVREAEDAYDKQVTAIAAHIRDHADTCPVVLLMRPPVSRSNCPGVMMEGMVTPSATS